MKYSLIKAIYHTADFKKGYGKNMEQHLTKNNLQRVKKHSGKFETLGKNCKILVTGAAGFIGSRVTKMFLGSGYALALIISSRSDISRIRSVIKKVKTYSVDLKDTRKVKKIIADFTPDAIVHFAGYYAVEHNVRDIALLVNNNVLATNNLLDAARTSGVRIFVNTSSFFVYRQSSFPLSEESTTRPFNLYALTKIQGEELCSFYAQRYGLPCVTLRLFSPYGPADYPHRLLPYMIVNLIKNKKLNLTRGTQKRDFIHIDDIARAYVCVLRNHRLSPTHEVFNIGTGKATSIRELYAKLHEITGNHQIPVWGSQPERSNELMVMHADATKARKVLKWRHSVSLDEGLMQLVKWFKEKREL